MDHRGARPSATLRSDSSQQLQSGQAHRSAELWAQVESLQTVRSARREATASRSLGVVHTPPAVATLMTQRLLRRVPRGSRLRVLDPGCGTAQLLSAVAREASHRGISVACRGIEVDARAARWARSLGPRVRAASGAQLESWCISAADYLTSLPCRERFDAIVANPPWVPIRDVSPAYRAALRAHLKLPARADLAVLFAERMLDDLAPNGRLCVIVPNKLLAADYATAFRQRLFTDVQVEEIWDLSAAAPFRGHATYPVVLVVRRRKPRAAARIRVFDADGRLRAAWPQSVLSRLPRRIVPLALPDEAAPLLERVFAGDTIGEHVPIRCGIAVSGFARGIGRGSERIVCSGDVRPFRVPSWRPFDPSGVGLDAPRLSRMRVPKVLVPGMFRRLHATYDARGELLGRVYYVTLEGATSQVRDTQRTLLLALLNSRLYSVLYRGLFDAVAQSGGWLRLNTPYLACLPWPAAPPPAALARVIEQLERADSTTRRRRLDDLVETLFGLSDSERALVHRLDLAWRPEPRRPLRRRVASRTRALAATDLFF